MSRSRTGAVVFVLATVMALTMSGCSGGARTSGSASSAGTLEGKAGAPARGGPVSDAGVASGVASGVVEVKGTVASADPVALSGRRQVRTADLGLRVGDVTAAAARVRSIAITAKGFVADERTSTDPGPVPVPLGRPEDSTTPPRKGPESVLTLRVPEVALDRVMDQVAAVGKLLSRGQSTSDVTGQYVDVASRLRTQRESVARVRALLDKATTIGQVVQVESELTRRQADLESLEAQLSALEDQTTLATLTVSLSPTTAAAAPTPARGAFIGGLDDGWQALLASVAVALTIVGAVLPFLILAAVIGLPVLLVLRRRRTQPSV